MIRPNSEDSSKNDLHTQLSAYYGPALPEQPLGQEAWQQLSAQLGRPPRKIRPLRGLARPTRRRRSTHDSVQEALRRVASQAQLPFVTVPLHCTFGAGRPEVRARTFPTPQLSIKLPLAGHATLEPDTLDVLVATGLARYLLLPKRRRLLQIVAIACVLLAVLGLGFYLNSVHGLLFLLPVLGISGTGAVWVARVRSYRLCYQADAQVVRWLGRTRTCQGLHALADYGRTSTRKRWQEPALTERIARVCGTRVEACSERLTMAR